jgi:hypothetical protein
MTVRAGNYEPIWDRTGEVPTPWAAEHRSPSRAAKAMASFYKRLQFMGSVNQAKRHEEQPLPKSLDVLHKHPDENLERYVPPAGDSPAAAAAGREERDA